MADSLVAVDSTGTVLAVGDTVNIYKAKIVGFRADVNNRLNILVIPALNVIKTNDASNPLNGLIDNKAILVSGYECSKVAVPGATIASVLPAGGDLTALENALTTAGSASPSGLPSNFLAPSLE